MSNSWQRYRLTLSRELSDKLASEFVQSLYLQSQSFVGAATQFFYELGYRWAPLLHCWAMWIEQKAQGTIALILRDAKPLGELSLARNWGKLYLNRPICGVKDELSGDTSGEQHPLLKQYLSECGCLEYFTYVDSGCYGTVVLELHKLGMRFQPLFFLSKNPHIPGFLNEIGVLIKDGEILNDSLECGFPHMYIRPSELARGNGRVEAVLRPSDYLSIRFGKAAMRGVRDAHIASDVSPLEAAQALLFLSQRARCGEFTGILGHASPEWTGKEEFLSNWPNDLCWT